MQVQQEQEPDRPQKRRQYLKRLPWKRLSAFIFTVLLIAFGATFWILSSLNIIKGPWVAILTALFVACGIVVGLLQWLFPVSFHKPEPSTASWPSSHIPQIVVHVPPFQPLSQPSPPALSISPDLVGTSPQAGSMTTFHHEQEFRGEGTSELIPLPLHRTDWGEAPDITNFHGREQELAKLEQWIVNDRCRLVAILGIGGIGKTTLAATLVGKIKDEFEYIFWRSLQNAPPIENMLKYCLQFFSDQRRIDLPEDIDGQTSLLIEYLRDHRCLLVLDNVETILQASNRAGQYQVGYEGYGKLLLRIGEAKHRSCLLLTSREKPKEIAHLEGNTLSVRSLSLLGLKSVEGQELLQDKGLSGSEEVQAALIHLYSGNPLALNLVSEPIREVFGGDIASFLKKGKAVFGEIRDLLDLQFTRLSEQEREILYWLAIEREAVSLDVLDEDIVHPVSVGTLLEALNSLRRRSMIESTDPERFTLQPVIMEYVTDRFVEQESDEIVSQTMGLFESHALIKADAKDYVRNSQERMILIPIAQRLLATFGKAGSEQKLTSLLSILHERYPEKPGYAAGNVLNLQIHIHADLRNTDFSHLVVWQAYLRRIALPDVKFAYANLEKAVFTDTFGEILSVAFSPNGKLVAAGTANGEIRLWQALDGTLLRNYQAHTSWVWSIAFSPDGKLLASGSEDQTVRLLEVATENCLKTLRGHTNRVRSVAFSPDGKLLASGSEDRTIGLWEVSTGCCLETLQGHTHWVYSVAFSPDGKLLASGSEDQTVRLWEIGTSRCFMILRGHAHRVYSVAFNPDGKLLASGSGDHTVRLWQVSTGHTLRTLQGHTSLIRSISFSPDGRILASGSEDQTVCLWEVNTNRCLHTLLGHSSWIRSVVFSPDGKLLASGGSDQTIHLWEVTSGHSLMTLEGYTNPLWSVVFSPDGKLLASGGSDQTVRLWDINSSYSLMTLQGHTHRVESVAFSPDGSLLASGSGDQTIRLWEVSTGDCLKTLQGHTNWIRFVTFSPNGSLLASAGDDQTVRLWEVSTGRSLHTLQGHTNEVRSVVFRPDGCIVASGSEDQNIRLWEVSTGHCFKTLQGHTNWVRSVAFSPDGGLLASGSDDQTIRLWEVSTGRCLHILQGKAKWVYSVAFNPHGNLLASGNGDQTVRLWEVSSGRCLAILQGHTNRVRSITFNYDGNALASCGEDGTIMLWDVKTGKCLKILRSDRPYERMNITGVVGLTEAQKASLRDLGAIEDEE